MVMSCQSQMSSGWTVGSRIWRKSWLVSSGMGCSVWVSGCVVVMGGAYRGGGLIQAGLLV